MDRVVQVIKRNGPDGELAAVTAQAAPSPVVTLDGGISAATLTESWDA